MTSEEKASESSVGSLQGHSLGGMSLLDNLCVVSASGLGLLRALLPSGTEKTSQFEPPQQTIVSSLECVRYLPRVCLACASRVSGDLRCVYCVGASVRYLEHGNKWHSLKIVTVFVWASWPSVSGGCLRAGSHLLLLKTLLESAVGTVM